MDGGVSVDPDDLAESARQSGCDLICISTYNGVALDFVEAVLNDLRASGCEIPVLVGGRLNQIPDASNTSLPVDVADRIAALGHGVPRCSRSVPALIKLAKPADQG